MDRKSYQLFYAGVLYESTKVKEQSACMTTQGTSLILRPHTVDLGMRLDISDAGSMSHSIYSSDIAHNCLCAELKRSEMTIPHLYNWQIKIAIMMRPKDKPFCFLASNIV